MKKRIVNRAVVLMLVILASCAPAGKTADPALPALAASETPVRVTAMFTPTQTATSTESPTDTPTRTFSPEPSGTQPLVFLPTATLQSTSTRRVPRQKTATPSPMATATPPSRTPTAATKCPIPTPEVFLVEPVSSPTDQLTQMVTVHLGHGEYVTIITESGTFTDTTSPFQVEVTLLPNTVHHLEVRGRVKQVWVNGCQYGGYTMSTRFDRHGAPLTIVHSASYP